MKVLLIHTYYQQKGGEDAVFEQDCKLISPKNEVVQYRFQNKTGSAGALQFLFSIWNIAAARKIRKIIASENPEVVHIHNTHFASGPIIIRTVKKMGTPVIMTLHNFRLMCPSATLLHDNKIFTDSLQRGFPWKAVFNKVYRNSFLQTFWLAFINWFHAKIGTWKMCDEFLVQTNFSKQLFASANKVASKDHFTIHQNCMAPEKVDKNPRSNHFLFIGRLSEEKGIKLLLQAFEENGMELRIGGDGPLLEFVKKSATENNKITYLGKLNKVQVIEEMKSCTALIFPSIWYEGMPMTILEAFATGTPVIASNCGAMAEMIQHKETGMLFTKGNIHELKTQLNSWQTLGEEEKTVISKNVHNEYLSKYTPEKYTERLLGIYNEQLHERNKDYAKGSKQSPAIVYNYS